MNQELTKAALDPENILVIHFGQMGDVILALPAFRALRARFPDAKLTAMTGKSAAAIARIADVFDDLIVVDRVELRDGPKIRSIAEILRMVRDTRRRGFDLIVDLHSLSETNLLGFLSGAKTRVFANRKNRSLDFLARSPAKPPREDKSKHVTDRYLDVLRPLGIAEVSRFVTIAPSVDDIGTITEMFENAGFGDKRPAGFFPGAGHPSRRWNLANFAELARRLRETEPRFPLVVILGPEERGLADEVRGSFPPGTLVLDRLSLSELLAATSLLRFLVSNDTGVVHVGAIAGANLVLVIDERAPTTFLPLSDCVEIVGTGTIDQIRVDEVFAAARRFLG